MFLFYIILIGLNCYSLYLIYSMYNLQRCLTDALVGQDKKFYDNDETIMWYDLDE